MKTLYVMNAERNPNWDLATIADKAKRDVMADKRLMLVRHAAFADNAVTHVRFGNNQYTAIAFSDLDDQEVSDINYQIGRVFDDTNPDRPMFETFVIDQ